MAACEGAVLVVDATQGVEAQTVANALLAMNANLEIIPAHQQDRPARCRTRARDAPKSKTACSIPADDAVLTSGKTGMGVHELLEAVVIQHPGADGRCGRAAASALIFD